jgi:hypothetical protein
MSNTYIAYWKPKNQVVLLHRTILYTEVEFDFGVKYLRGDLGPASDFEVICNFDDRFDSMIPLEIRIKDFCNGVAPECMAMKIVVTGLSKKMLSDKGGTALDIGNYIYNKFGLVYEMRPEYSNMDEPKNSLTYFVSRRNFHAQDNLIKFISQSEGKPESLVRACAATFNIVIKHSDCF